MQVTFFGRAADLLRGRACAAISPMPGAKVLKIGSSRFTADRRRRSSCSSRVEAPDAAAGADVDVMDPLGGEFLGPANVVDVIGIAAVDEDVVGFEQRREIVNASSTAAAGTISQIARGFAASTTKSASEDEPTAFSWPVPATACGERSLTTHWWPCLHEPADHVGPHAAQADHSELHRKLQVEEGRNPPSRQRQNELKEYIPVHRCIGEHDGAAA